MQVAPSVRTQQGHGQEMGMFGLPLPRTGPFIIGSATDQVGSPTTLSLRRLPATPEQCCCGLMHTRLPLA